MLVVQWCPYHKQAESRPFKSTTEAVHNGNPFKQCNSDF